MEITTDMTKVKESKCFGIAWDGEVAECKICDLANICKQKTMAQVKQATPSKKAEPAKTETTMKPATKRPEPKEETPAAPAKEDKKPAKKPAKPEVQYDSDMPDFKPMSVDELLELAKERGLDVADFDKYTNVGIKKMRVTMALKKTYEK